jgi:aminomethyltransferase
MPNKELGRKTPFYNMHLRHHAHMVNFFNFAMPLRYTSMVSEHRRVRSTVGMFDLSHMGEIEVRGPAALDFVQKMTINDASRLQYGQVQYTAMCYPDGGIVDDFLLYRLENSYLLVVNAANIDKNFRWLLENIDGQAVVENQSDGWALLAIQGPQSQDVLVKLTDLDLKEIHYYRFDRGQVGGCPMLISRTGYTGEDGFELYLEPSYARQVWESVLEAGGEFQLEPVGLGARDSLRLEMKYALYGQDIDETINPLESGLGWITKLDKGDFIGRSALLAIKEGGLVRKLVGFEMTERAIPRSHYDLCAGGQKVGKVTSGGFSPSLNKGIGLGYLPMEHAGVGTELEVLIRGKAVPAQVVQTPFYKMGTRKS